VTQELIGESLELELPAQELRLDIEQHQTSLKKVLQFRHRMQEVTFTLEKSERELRMQLHLNYI